MRRRVFLGLGAASITAGALHSTGAFSSLEAGRGVAVSAADDSSALLKIEDRETEEPEFTNQTNVTMKITFEPEDDSVTFDGQDADTFVLELDPGPDQSETVNLDTSGVTPIEVTATLRDDSDESIGSIELEREFGVPQASQLRLTANVESAGNSGKFTFEIINDSDDINVTIDAVAIADGTVDGDNDPDEVDTELSSDNTEAPGPIPVLGREPKTENEDENGGGDFIFFNDSIPLDAGDDVEFETDRIVDSDGDFAKYNNGGTLAVWLQLSDTSKAEFDMEVEGDGNPGDGNPGGGN